MRFFALKSGKIVDENELRLLAFSAVEPSDEHYLTFIKTVDALAEMLGTSEEPQELKEVANQ